MLSWQPSDPTSLCSETNSNTETTPLLPCWNTSYCPWRNSCSSDQCCVKSTSQLGSFGVLHDWQSEMDCIQSHQNQPWGVKLQASLLDELPENNFSCPVDEELRETLSRSLFSTSTDAASSDWYGMVLVLNCECHSSTLIHCRSANQHIVEELFSKCCLLNRCAMATECIPFLRLMSAQRSTGSRIRQ